MRGFIERIEEDNVYVIFDDGSTKMFNRSDFTQEISIDMQVDYQGGSLRVYPVDEALKEEINQITKKIFVSFKDRKKK